VEGLLFFRRGRDHHDAIVSPGWAVFIYLNSKPGSSRLTSDFSYTATNPSLFDDAAVKDGLEEALVDDIVDATQPLDERVLGFELGRIIGEQLLELARAVPACRSSTFK